jgi:poly(U)-specific endoribonuclease
MNFLTQKGVVTSDPQTHRDVLKTIWFGLYSRGMGKISSSGFEHVFLSEVKNGTVMGLHNWIYLSEAEKSGDLDYKGWSKKIDLGNVRIFDNANNKDSGDLFVCFRRKDRLLRFVFH